MTTEQEDPYAAPQSQVLDTEEEFQDGELAERGTRFVAALVDGILAMAVTLPLMVALGGWALATSGKEVPMQTTLLMSLGGIVAFILFHGYLLAKSGQTIGKKLMGIAIVSAETGELIPAGKLVGLRYAPIWITNLIPVVGQFIPLVDVLFIFREDRRCLHDLIAGSKVIKVKK